MSIPPIRNPMITPFPTMPEAKTKTSAAPCCGPTPLATFQHVGERGPAAKSADTLLGRPKARSTLRPAGKALRLAAQNLGSQLLELLARLGFDHRGPDDRRHPHLRDEFAVIDDLGRGAEIDDARREFRCLQVAAHQPRVDFARRSED